MDGDGRNLRWLLTARNGFGCGLTMLLPMLLVLSSLLVEEVVVVLASLSTRLGSSTGLLEHISCT